MRVLPYITALAAALAQCGNTPAAPAGGTP